MLPSVSPLSINRRTAAYEIAPDDHRQNFGSRPDFIAGYRLCHCHCCLLRQFFRRAKGGIGRRIGTPNVYALFEHVLGVSGKDTGEQIAAAKISIHLSREEVAKTLNDASRQLLSDDPPSSRLTGPFFGLPKCIQRISIWATVKVIVIACSHDGKSVNMFELRDRLASTIDDGVVAYVKEYFARLAVLVISGESSIFVLLAFGVRQLPL